MKKILIIAPHGDDEVLGMGGTLAKHFRVGDEIYRCIVTRPYLPDWSEAFIQNREQEIKDSGKILGVKKDFLLGFPTIKLDTIPQKELNGCLLEVVQEVKPDIVCVSSQGDLNVDHRLVFASTLVATRPMPGSPIKRVLSYEVVSETEWGRPLAQFIPNYYVALTDADTRIKLMAMQAYASEIRNYPHPRSLETLVALAKLRGAEVGEMAAEAFMVIREIN